MPPILPLLPNLGMGGGGTPPAPGERSIGAKWLGGMSLTPPAPSFAGFRGMTARWLGGAGNVPGVSTTPSFRGMGARWLGGTGFHTPTQPGFPRQTPGSIGEAFVADHRMSLLKKDAAATRLYKRQVASRKKMRMSEAPGVWFNRLTEGNKMRAQLLSAVY